MNNQIIRKTKWFWPWQDQEEEAWLEKMSHEGFHLKQPRSLGRYQFIPGRPSDYVYRLDFQDSLKNKSKDDYLQLFTETGWEYLGEMGGWQYFRKSSQTSEGSEIFTDPDTKIAKYNRYLTYLGFIFPSYLVIFVAFWGTWPDWMMWLNIAIILIASAFSIVTSVKITRRIKALKAL